MTDNDRSADAGDLTNETASERSEMDRSLQADINALLDDGKMYVEAELAFQKSRLSLAANRSKSGVIYILAALAFLHLALIGLVIGAIISLIEWLGPVGATSAVVGTLLIGVAIFLWLARGKFVNLANAFKDDAPTDTAP